ncbi:MAG TPA: hypothetical protein VHK23_06300, partial [Miltoncostaeaceae bacterium]|nr:hypothetical protein [Miltoncostaeaceae bacterium]
MDEQRDERVPEVVGDRLDTRRPGGGLPDPLAPVVEVEDQAGGGWEDQVVGRCHPWAQGLEVGRQDGDDRHRPDPA